LLYVLYQISKISSHQLQIYNTTRKGYLSAVFLSFLFFLSVFLPISFPVKPPATAPTPAPMRAPGAPPHSAPIRPPAAPPATPPAIIPPVSLSPWGVEQADKEIPATHVIIVRWLFIVSSI